LIERRTNYELRITNYQRIKGMGEDTVETMRKPSYKPRAGMLNIPVGWKREAVTGRLVEDAVEQAVIALAKDLRDGGLSQSEIMRKFREDKVPNRAESLWTSAMVRKRLDYEGLKGRWAERKARLDEAYAARVAAAESDRKELEAGRRPSSPLEGSDAVSWGEHWVANRDGSARAYWPHQVEDLRAEEANIVHLDGRDVGKTANLTTLALHYALTTKKGTGLVAAALGGQLMAIWEEIEFQLDNNVRLEECIARGRNGQRKMQRFPYPRLEFANGSVLYFRPAGAYGESFRSLHVERVWVDEGAWLSEEAWRALRQCLKAGGKLRVYSTPNGVRNATYYRLTTSRRWRVFRWPSWLNPNWTGEHEADLLEFYGGRATAGWQHEVAGEHGAPSYGAFHGEHFALALQDVPEYRKVVITNNELADCSSEQDVEQRFETLLGIWPESGEYYVGADLGYTNDPTEILVFRKAVGCSPEAVGRVGETGGLRLVLRVHMEKVAYPQIAQCLGVIDSLLSPAGIGIDNGGNGLAVVQELLSLDKYKREAGARGLDAIGSAPIVPKDPRDPRDSKDPRVPRVPLPHPAPKLPAVPQESRFIGRLFGFDFGSTTPFELPDGTQVKKRTKELMTSLINRALQRREIAFPSSDPEIADQFLTQTYSLNNGAVTYSKGNDHIIDAVRCMVLARDKAAVDSPYNDDDYSVRPPLPLMVEVFTLPSMKNFPW